MEEKIFDDPRKLPLSRSIFNAFLYLEQICSQIIALQKTIKGVVDSSDAEFSKRNLRVSKHVLDEDFRDSTSKWITRCTLDRIELSSHRGHRPKYHCAIQFSIAANDSNNEEFFPHAAVLVAPSEKANPWECDDFMLDTEFLSSTNEEEGDYPWRPTDTFRWIEDEDEAWVARVVPLAWLSNEAKVREHILDVLLEEIDFFQERKLESTEP